MNERLERWPDDSTLVPQRLVDEGRALRCLRTRRGVSPEMALRLGRFLGNGTESWLTMQTHWPVEHDPDALRAAADVEPAAA